MKKKLLAVCVSLSLGALATSAMAQDNNAVQAPDHGAVSSTNTAPTGVNANDSDKTNTDENMTQNKPMHKPMTHRNVVQNHNGEGAAEARDNGYYTHSKEKADIAWQHKLVGSNSNMNDTPTGWDGASRPATIPKGDNPKWYQTSYNNRSVDNDTTGEHHHKWHHKHDMNNGTENGDNNTRKYDNDSKNDNGEPSTWDKVKQGTKDEAHKASEATKRGWDKTKEKTTQLKDDASAKMHNNESNPSASSPAPASGN